jgi:N-acetylglucosamine-6-phosphate deacetylase
MQAYTSKYVFDGTNLHANMVVVTEHNRIKDLIPLSKLETQVDIINCGAGVITPAFIDLQVNGCGGVLFNQNISLNTLETIYKTWLNLGVGWFLPTLITCNFKQIIQALEVVKQWFEQYGATKGVIGIHIEGPFISKIKCGIHDVDYIIEPTMPLLEKIVSYGHFFPIKLTIAPEQFTPEQIEYLVANNIILAIGHTNATAEETTAAIKLGAKTATHLFNAMSGLTARNAGAICAILAENVYAGVIADMLHVDKNNIKLINKIKPQKIYLVSDAVTAVASSLTSFDLCGKTIFVQGDKYVDVNNVLAGANLTLNQAVKNCIESCEISISDTLAMVTSIPAQVLGLEHKMGYIKPGYPATLSYLDLTNYNCKTL